MALEDRIIFKVDSSEGVKSIADLKNNIKAYKEAVAQAEIGTEEYTEALNLLKLNQNALKDAMYATSASMDTVEKSAAGMGESYNSLVHRMAALKEEWRSVDQSTKEGRKRFEELSGQIKDVNDRLKGMDSGIGNFQRNVGNYTSAIDNLADAFKKTAGGAGNLIAPIGGVTMGLKTLSKTPVIAILGVLANLLNTIIGGMKGSEENANAMAKAMSGLSAVGNVVKNVMDLLGKAVAKVAQWFTDLAKNIIPSFRKAIEAQEEITQREIALSEKRRAAVQKNADAEKEIAELRAKAADKEKYDASQRIAFLETAVAKEREISQRSVDIAKAEYELLLEKSKLSQNAAEENDKLAEAYAKMVNAETNYYNKSRELTAQIVTAKKEAAKATADAQKAEKKATLDSLTLQKKQWDERLATEREGSGAWLSTRMVGLEVERQMEEEKAKQTITDEKELAFALKYINDKYEADRLRAAERYAQDQIDIERKAMENRMNALKEGSSEYLQAAVALRRFEMLSIQQQELESDEDFYARKLAAEKAYVEAKKALTQQQINMGMSVVSATQSMLSSLVDLYESDERAQLDNFNKVKGLKIASATMETINGAISAYMQTVSSIPPPLGIALGAVQAAAVTASGVANINKIRQTQPNGKTSDVAFSPASAPNIAPSVPQTALITGARDEQILNSLSQPIEAYIVDSKLEAKQKQRDTTNAETSF